MRLATGFEEMGHILGQHSPNIRSAFT